MKLDHDFTGDMQKYMDGHSVAAFSENAVNAAIRSLSIMFEDQEPVNSTWISWFCFENDFGAGKMKCPLDKAEYEIDSAEAMYDFMVLWMNV